MENCWWLEGNANYMMYYMYVQILLSSARWAKWSPLGKGAFIGLQYVRVIFFFNL